MVAEILRPVVSLNSVEMPLVEVIKSTMVADILHPVLAINFVKISLFEISN